MSDCNCADAGIPNGYVCGDPSCHRGKRARTAMAEVFKALAPQQEKPMADKIVDIRVRVPDDYNHYEVVAQREQHSTTPFQRYTAEVLSVAVVKQSAAPEQPKTRFEAGKWYNQRGANGAVRVINIAGNFMVGRDIHGDVRIYNLEGDYLRDGQKRDPTIQRYDLIPAPRTEPVIPGPTAEQFNEVLSIVKGLTNEVAQLWRLINP